MKIGGYKGPQRPPTLLEAYLGNDVQHLCEDALRRPEHYSERQHELLNDLREGARSLKSVDYRDVNDVFLTYVRETEPAKAVDEAFKRAQLTSEVYDTDEPSDKWKPPVYEDQLEPGDVVIV